MSKGSELEELRGRVSKHLRASLQTNAGSVRSLADRLDEEFELRAKSNLHRIDKAVADKRKAESRAIIAERRASALGDFIDRYVESASPLDIIEAWQKTHPLPPDLAISLSREAGEGEGGGEAAAPLDALTLEQLQASIAGLEAALAERTANEARLAEELAETRDGLLTPWLVFLRPALQPPDNEALTPRMISDRVIEEVRLRNEARKALEHAIDKDAQTIEELRGCLSSAERSRESALFAVEQSKLTLAEAHEAQLESERLAEQHRREAERQRSIAESYRLHCEELRDGAAEIAVHLATLMRTRRAQQRLAHADAAADLPL
ncbi:hypothetical protein [Methylosinus sp. LW4]|uniref:hypothetical protein n=1 Tax=Methylosinus sp. LW4 TaxID=136993 RepID=UPI000382629B|nr:hypothetical protein [Methylosinus sp. LW4]